MSNYTYTQGRPAGNLTPAAQRSEMQTNNDSNYSIWTNEDHFGFGNNNGGTHQKVRFPIIATPAVPAGQASVIYPSQSVDSGPPTNIANSVFQNSQNLFLLSWVKALGVVSSGRVLLQSFNVNAGIPGGLGIFNITLTNALPSPDYGVLALSAANGGAMQYTVTANNTFTLRNASGFDQAFTFVVVQR